MAATDDGFTHHAEIQVGPIAVEGCPDIFSPQLNTAHPAYTWTANVVDDFHFSCAALQQNPEFGEIVIMLLEAMSQDFEEKLPALSEPRVRELIDPTQSPPLIECKKLADVIHAFAGAAANLQMWGLARPAKMLELALKRLQGIDTERTESGDFRWPQQPSDNITQPEAVTLLNLVVVVRERVQLVVAWYKTEGTKKEDPQ